MTLKGTQAYVWKFYIIHLIKSFLLGLWWYSCSNISANIQNLHIIVTEGFIVTAMNIYGVCFITFGLLKRNLFQIYLYIFILGIESLILTGGIVFLAAHRMIIHAAYKGFMLLCNFTELLYNIHVYKNAKYEFFWDCSKRAGLRVCIQGKCPI